MLHVFLLPVLVAGQWGPLYSKLQLPEMEISGYGSEAMTIPAYYNADPNPHPQEMLLSYDQQLTTPPSVRVVPVALMNRPMPRIPREPEVATTFSPPTQPQPPPPSPSPQPSTTTEEPTTSTEKKEIVKRQTTLTPVETTTETSSTTSAEPFPEPFGEFIIDEYPMEEEKKPVTAAPLPLLPTPPDLPLLEENFPRPGMVATQPTLPPPTETLPPTLPPSTTASLADQKKKTDSEEQNSMEMHEFYVEIEDNVPFVDYKEKATTKKVTTTSTAPITSTTTTAATTTSTEAMTTTEEIIVLEESTEEEEEEEVETTQSPSTTTTPTTTTTSATTAKKMKKKKSSKHAKRRKTTPAFNDNPLKFGVDLTTLAPVTTTTTMSTSTEPTTSGSTTAWESSEEYETEAHHASPRAIPWNPPTKHPAAVFLSFFTSPAPSTTASSTVSSTTSVTTLSATNSSSRRRKTTTSETTTPEPSTSSSSVSTTSITDSPSTASPSTTSATASPTTPFDETVTESSTSQSPTRDWSPKRSTDSTEFTRKTFAVYSVEAVTQRVPTSTAKTTPRVTRPVVTRISSLSSPPSTTSTPTPPSTHPTPPPSVHPSLVTSAPGFSSSTPLDTVWDGSPEGEEDVFPLDQSLVLFPSPAPSSSSSPPSTDSLESAEAFPAPPVRAERVPSEIPLPVSPSPPSPPLDTFVVPKAVPPPPPLPPAPSSSPPPAPSADVVEPEERIEEPSPFAGEHINFSSTSRTPRMNTQVAPSEVIDEVPFDLQRDFKLPPGISRQRFTKTKDGPTAKRRPVEEKRKKCCPCCADRVDIPERTTLPPRLRPTSELPIVERFVENPPMPVQSYLAATASPPVVPTPLLPPAESQFVAYYPAQPSPLLPPPPPPPLPAPSSPCSCPPPPPCCEIKPCCPPPPPCCPTPPPLPCCRPQQALCCQPNPLGSFMQPAHQFLSSIGSAQFLPPAMSSCGGCAGSAFRLARVKRTTCQSCSGRRKRETDFEAHRRVKRSMPCVSCTGGRKKRSLFMECAQCTNLGGLLGRFKRSLACVPCNGRKKRSPEPCRCASQAASAAVENSPVAVSHLSSDHTITKREAGQLPSSMSQMRTERGYESFFTCDSSCCDFTRCDEVRILTQRRAAAALLR